MVPDSPEASQNQVSVLLGSELLSSTVLTYLHQVSGCINKDEILLQGKEELANL